jgi:hypothetical protein
MKRLLIALSMLAAAPLCAQMPEAYLQPLFDQNGCMIQPQAPACQPDNPASSQWLIWAHGKNTQTKAFSYTLDYADGLADQRRHLAAPGQASGTDTATLKTDSSVGGG